MVAASLVALALVGCATFPSTAMRTPPSVTASALPRLTAAPTGLWPSLSATSAASTVAAAPTSPPSTAVAPATLTPAAAPSGGSATPSASSLPLPGLGWSTSVPIDAYRVVRAYPHDGDAFTQGLVFRDGVLYESTGRYGASSVREVALETGVVIRSRALPDDLWGEGVALVGERIVQLTWRSNVGLVYDRQTFEPVGEFRYPTEGWGLTYDGELLIMSDGTAALHFVDPDTFEEVCRVQVHDAGFPVVHLNELEFVRGEVLANVWLTDLIARIDPATGLVTGWIDLTGILDEADLGQPVDVLNGIATDERHGRLFVTGKLWPTLFEIELVPRDEGQVDGR